MTFDKPIELQRIDSDTEKWTSWHTLHAYVNKSGGSEYLKAGAIQSQSTRVFEVRYFHGIEAIDTDRGSYRIIYRSTPYQITDYDDFEESHRTVKLLGVSC